MDTPLPPLPGLVPPPPTDLQLQQFIDFITNFSNQHYDDPRFQVLGSPGILQLVFLGRIVGGVRQPVLWIKKYPAAVLPSDGQIKPNDLVFQLDSLGLTRYLPNNAWLTVTTFYSLNDLNLTSAAGSTVVTNLDLRRVVLPPAAEMFASISADLLGCGESAIITITGGMTPYQVTVDSSLLRVTPLDDLNKFLVSRLLNGDVDPDNRLDYQVAATVTSYDTQLVIVPFKIKSWCDLHYGDIEVTSDGAFIDCAKTVNFQVAGGQGNFIATMTDQTACSLVQDGRTLHVTRRDSYNSPNPEQPVLHAELVVHDPELNQTVRVPITTASVCNLGDTLPPGDIPPQVGFPQNKWFRPTFIPLSGFFAVSNADFTLDYDVTSDSPYSGALGTELCKDGKRYQEFIIELAPRMLVDSGNLVLNRMFLGIQGDPGTNLISGIGAFWDSLGGVLTTSNPLKSYSTEPPETQAKRLPPAVLPAARLPAVGRHIVMVAVDFDRPSIPVWFGMDGVWFNRGDPSAGKNPVSRLASDNETAYRTALYCDAQTKGHYTVTLARNNAFPPPDEFVPFESDPVIE